jgi:hypothetical protein
MLLARGDGKTIHLEALKIAAYSVGRHLPRLIQAIASRNESWKGRARHDVASFLGRLK